MERKPELMQLNSIYNAISQFHTQRQYIATKSDLKTLLQNVMTCYSNARILFENIQKGLQVFYVLSKKVMFSQTTQVSSVLNQHYWKLQKQLENYIYHQYNYILRRSFQMKWFNFNVIIFQLVLAVCVE
ncbi:Hypothetical_protein [Hexamita inflata]|uniref:Hypothetical_protein n=1 Tax=Hexamita inflata TaxID=28002 RepID=A0AA86U0A9_9EUKA|nr:Hypothetical protein HINF_LOCUS14373 [Hexamita inflata]